MGKEDGYPGESNSGRAANEDHFSGEEIRSLRDESEARGGSEV